MLPNRYPGACACGARVPALAGILVRSGRRWSISCAACARIDRPVWADPDAALAGAIDPELLASEPDAAAHAGRYLRRSLERGVSHVWTDNGRERYRNRRGLCEDAPCCGCCNA